MVGDWQPAGWLHLSDLLSLLPSWAWHNCEGLGSLPVPGPLQKCTFTYHPTSRCSLPPRGGTSPLSHLGSKPKAGKEKEQRGREKGREGGKTPALMPKHSWR
jgi:hypothetical protein